MKFEEAHRKMEAIADKHFPKYTIQSDKYCDGDYKIEACHVPTRKIDGGYLHKLVYYNCENNSMYHRQLDVDEEQVIEIMEHPPLPNGLGLTDCPESLASFTNIGSIDKLYKS